MTKHEKNGVAKKWRYLWIQQVNKGYYEIRKEYSYVWIDYSHILLIIAIWPCDRIRRPEHPTVEHGSCDESV